ncbi:MAG: ABC transporter substrate-binding protein [Rubrivivax sp.]
MKRRDLAGLAAAAALPGWAAAQGPAKVLRVAFPAAETGFDPAQTYDIYSRTVTAHIFEAPYRYDHLARPATIRPNTAAEMPEVADEYTRWTIRIRPGILFQDDPAFGGQPRELTAADYVYAWKRFVDPVYKSPAVAEMLEYGFVGLAELRQAALDGKRGLDYDKPIEGLQAADRYTIRLKLKAPRPRLVDLLANNSQMGAIAREVVDRYGAEIMAHPVGTGPFRLAQWRRASRMVLERNPTYREVVYDERPAADDAWGQQIAARLKGRRLPMVDRVEISVIEESQPNWLAFLNGQIDAVSVPGEFLLQAAPGGKLSPALEKKGIRLARVLNPDSVYMYFDMRDPLIGGTTPEKVAVRRAMSLAIDVPRIIDRLYRGQGIVAQSPIVPHTSGYDPAFKSEMSDHDPARAKALLDLYGYVDRDGDGIREAPDGTPLRVTMGSQSDQFSRGFNEVLQKNFRAVGIDLRFSIAQWPEQLKAARAGKLQIWSLGGSATVPDGQGSLARYQSAQAGAQNFARFVSPEFDRLYEQLQRLPDGPEREAVFRQCKLIAAAQMPYKFITHRIANDLTWPHLVGHRRPVFWRDWYQFVDIEPRSA